jgi:hypothetical protein
MEATNTERNTMTTTFSPTCEVLDLDTVLAGAFGEKYQASQSQNPCIACGRNVSQKNGHIVLIGGGGTDVLHPDDNDQAMNTDPGYMGGFPVGSECIKSVPAEYRIKLISEVGA